MRSLGLALAAVLLAPLAHADPVCHANAHNEAVLLTPPSHSLSYHFAHGDLPARLLFEDADGDGLGNPHASLATCADAVDGYVDNNLDEDEGVVQTSAAPDDRNPWARVRTAEVVATDPDAQADAD